MECWNQLTEPDETLVKWSVVWVHAAAFLVLLTENNGVFL
jgi:hypothetical protein